MRDPKKPPQPTQDVISLDRYREQLLQGQRSRRGEDLFEAPDPVAAIRALPRDEFFYIIHEVGFPEAMEIFAHGTAEQVQAVLDFSIWNRDRVDLEKSEEWLAAMVEAPIASLGKWAEGLDVELVALLLRQRATIYDLTQEEEPETPEGALWTSPDRFFALDLKGDPDQARVTQRLVDSLYRYSPGMMRRLLVGIRAESDTELEETAYRWRAGRMADLGFVDFYEALAAYQELDPAGVRVGAAPAEPQPTSPAADRHLRLPALMAERLSGKTAFARGVAGLASPELGASVHAALVLLANQVLSADRATPGDDDAVREVLERMSATLDLAVEFLAHGEPERESLAVASVPLVVLHRLGWSLIAKLRRLALTLLRNNPFSPLRPAIDIFEPEDAEVLGTLSRPRPVFPRLLDRPAAAGERPFASLADLAVATRAVERAAAAVELLIGLGIRPAQLSSEALSGLGQAAGLAGPIDAAAVDTGSVARTVLVAELLGRRSQPLVALSGGDLSEFKESFIVDGQLVENAREKCLSSLRNALADKAFEGAVADVALRWIASLAPLGPVLDSSVTP